MDLASTLAATLLSNGPLRGPLASAPSRRSETTPSAAANARPACGSAAATACGGAQLQATVVPSVSSYLQDSQVPSADVFAIVRRGSAGVAGGLQSLVAVGGVMQQPMQVPDGVSLLPGDNAQVGDEWVGRLDAQTGR